MNISYNWLKDYINLSLKPEEVAHILTNIGLEVEAIETYEQVKGGMNGLVIGKVLTCEKHPNADKLRLTTVDIGKGEPLNIVCGAPNVAAGQKVVVAPAGVTLFKGDESLTLQKVKIRGVESEGMICAEDEIGIGTNHKGIIVLEDDAPVGKPAKEYYNIEHDTIFVIGLTPNRIDSGSHYGTARDLAAFLSQNSEIQLTRPDVSAFKKDADDYLVEVVIENANSCRRYAGVSVTGVKLAPSPGWLQKKLLAIGLTPISNVVDITNFVLHELGQPLHAFDADRLAGRKIVVKNMPAGTRFITLDGQEHELSSEDLMICDAEHPVALAGIFGGLESGITDTTENVFIESAYFDPVSVRRTSKRLGILTDSSFRFERGVDPTMTVTALKRAAMLMKELAGGKIASDIVDVYPSPIKPCSVEINYQNIDRLIGKKIEHGTIKKILENLEFEIQREGKQGLTVLVPPCRVDVTREADVIEEILRIYGYNNVEISEELHGSISFTNKPDREKIANIISDYLTSNGFNEIICNSLTSAGYYDNLSSYKAVRLVRILNPLSNDLNVLRQTLLFGGLESIVHNTNRKNSDLLLYEFGTCYFYDKAEKTSDPLDNYSEYQHLALFLTGRKNEMSWLAKDDNFSFFDLKAFIENIFRKLGFQVDDFQTAGLENRKDIFSEGFAFKYEKDTIAEFGPVNRQLLKIFDLKAEVLYANLYWDRILEKLRDFKIQFSELPKYPEVKRDLSMILDKSVTYEQIKKLAYQTGGNLLKHVHLFDVYEGEGIESGRKSYAVSFVLQDLTKTLVDSEIDEVMDRLMSAYEKVLNAKIRK
ncbi:MAG TPA: phenylalanine--tRNA ligase subunit beta [Bacteroidales bacterium]|nr:phenylalanine--tRNA ligase subunit beta [Bacteroidales bacterium]